VQASKALVDGPALFALLRRLEPSARPIDELSQTAGLVGALCVSLREDPGRTAVYVVASEPPGVRGDNGQRWLNERSGLLARSSPESPVNAAT
jgi:hypothetical protein